MELVLCGLSQEFRVRNAGNVWKSHSIEMFLRTFLIIFPLFFKDLLHWEISFKSDDLSATTHRTTKMR